MRLDAKPLILSAVPSCARYSQDDKDKLINVKINPAVPTKSLKLSNQIESKSWSPSLEPKQWNSDNTWPTEKKWLKKESTWKSPSDEQINPNDISTWKKPDSKRQPQTASLKIESEFNIANSTNENNDKDPAVDEIAQLINLIDLNQSCQAPVDMTEKGSPTISELLNDPQITICPVLKEQSPSQEHDSISKKDNAPSDSFTVDENYTSSPQPAMKLSAKSGSTETITTTTISTVHRPTLQHKPSIAESIIQSINSFGEDASTAIQTSPSASQEILKSLTIDDDEGFSNISQSDYIQDDFELVQEEADWDIVSV
ncbi:hypothetical protein HDV06_005154 [Boothiomyces sp. JEL0866]|nr:hypothetical protein HDV06_005154 [Boothiomyces sp. JEL0866]